MGVLVGDAPVTRFSYLEYQVIMLLLAGMICVGLLAIELTLNRFQVLPLLFPGMFSIRERRFYFFDFDVSNGAVAERLRSQSKMLVRMTLCVVLSYLWQRCVMDTTQQIGSGFPKQECDIGSDCFASTVHFMTLVKRQYEPVDCAGEPKAFPSRVVVTCIRFVPPSASSWLMHFAIAHSVTQLNLKAYEVMVWIAGNSPCVRRTVGVLIFASLIIFVGFFFSGAMREFVSSWLSFVMILSIPVFLWQVYQSAKVLEALWVEESARVQYSIEQHLNSALADFDLENTQNDDDNLDQGAKRNADAVGKPTITMRARNLFKHSGLERMVQFRGGPSQNGLESDTASAASRTTASSEVQSSMPSIGNDLQQEADRGNDVPPDQSK